MAAAGRTLSKIGMRTPNCKGGAAWRCGARNAHTRLARVPVLARRW
jgi:hypothetical protein